jgi:phage terminase small subunit
MARQDDFVGSDGQLRFVYFWRGNDSEAARLAGFSRPSVEGFRCKSHPAVRRLLQLKQEAIALANVPSAPAPVNPDDILNTEQLKFVCAWRGNPADAARAAGLAPEEGRALLSRPNVARVIAQKQNLLIASSIKAQFGDAPAIAGTTRIAIQETHEGSDKCSHATH